MHGKSCEQAASKHHAGASAAFLSALLMLIWHLGPLQLKSSSNGEDAPAVSDRGVRSNDLHRPGDNNKKYNG